MAEQRETLGSRLGFILLSVGCAVGLGNVWRFPYITGQCGGGFFVLLYLFFLLLLGFPILLMELSIGRAGRSTLVGCYRKLSGGKIVWAGLSRIAFLGNVLLMMYYTTVSGWLLAYAKYYICGDLRNLEGQEQFGSFFGGLLASPGRIVGYMLITCLLGGLLCAGGLRKVVERSVKYLMAILFLLMAAMLIMSLQLPGAREGLSFYLVPNVDRFSTNMSGTIFAAMGQAFFTLSLGVGSMTIFGSYLDADNKRSLGIESLHIIGLDTLVAIMAGLIIFPICATFHVNVAAGPGLVFVSLPTLMEQLVNGRVWGGVFFAFMAVAALTTVIAVFENMVAFLMDEAHFSRATAAATVAVGIAVLSLPCALGFNVLAGFEPWGAGTGSSVLDLEDFLVSQNLLPLGGLMSVIFCSFGCGWGWKGFIGEAESGQKWKYSSAMRFYCRWILPVIVIAVFVLGYLDMFTGVLK